MDDNKQAHFMYVLTEPETGFVIITQLTADHKT